MLFCNQLDLMPILRSISRFTGNFLGYFRVKDDLKRQFPLISDESLSNRREEEVEDNWACKNTLATLFSPKEEEGWSCDSTGFSYQNSDDKEVKAEARFLKACGTLLKSPVEFRKVSEKLEDFPINGGEFGTSEFYSWTPIKKLHWEEQPESIPVTAAKHCEALEEESGSSERPSTSLVFEGIDSASEKGSEIEISSLETEVLYPTCNSTISAVTPVLPSEATRCTSKFVRSETEVTRTVLAVAKFSENGINGIVAAADSLGTDVATGGRVPGGIKIHKIRENSIYCMTSGNRQFTSSVMDVMLKAAKRPTMRTKEVATLGFAAMKKFNYKTIRLLVFGRNSEGFDLFSLCLHSGFEECEIAALGGCGVGHLKRNEINFQNNMNLKMARREVLKIVKAGVTRCRFCDDPIYGCTFIGHKCFGPELLDENRVRDWLKE